MPGIVALVRLLSLDMTAQLCGAGYGLAALSVADATNTTPIVVRTATAHGVVNPAHVVITGVGGNVATNNAGLDPDGSFTNYAWHAVRVDDTRLALYSIDEATGSLVPSTGSGLYTSGGSLRRALTDGRILIGRQYIYEQSAPPRVILIPTASKWPAKSVYNASAVNGYPSAEVRRQNQQRSIRTEEVLFEVHCWGAATPADPDTDVDLTQVIYQAVIQSAHRLAPGTWDVTDGQWADQKDGATQIDKLGHEFVFGLSLRTPILGKLLPYAPADVSATTHTWMQPLSGTLEQGCQEGTEEGTEFNSAYSSAFN